MFKVTNNVCLPHERTTLWQILSTEFIISQYDQSQFPAPDLRHLPSAPRLPYALWNQIGTFMHTLGIPSVVRTSSSSWWRWRSGTQGQSASSTRWNLLAPAHQQILQTKDQRQDCVPCCLVTLGRHVASNRAIVRVLEDHLNLGLGTLCCQDSVGTRFGRTLITDYTQRLGFPGWG